MHTHTCVSELWQQQACSQNTGLGHGDPQGGRLKPGDSASQAKELGSLPGDTGEPVGTLKWGGSMVGSEIPPAAHREWVKGVRLEETIVDANLSFSISIYTF